MSDMEDYNKDLADAQKYRRVRKINNKSSKECRQRKQESIKTLDKDETEEEERSCVLIYEHDKLLQKVYEERNKVEKALVRCKDCNSASYVRRFMSKDEKSADDYEKLWYYIKMKGSTHNN